MEIKIGLDDLNKTVLMVECDSWEVNESRLICLKNGQTIVAWVKLSGIRYILNQSCKNS